MRSTVSRRRLCLNDQRHCLSPRIASVLSFKLCYRGLERLAASYVDKASAQQQAGRGVEIVDEIVTVPVRILVEHGHRGLVAPVVFEQLVTPTATICDVLVDEIFAIGDANSNLSARLENAFYLG